jgi:uncharacterized membrane protein
MNTGALTRILALGMVSGMRSMAGLAAFTLPRHGIARPFMALAAVGEMIADKTPMVGDRIEALPLAGRALMGATVGVLIAREERQNALLGGVLGAGAAVIAAHLAYQGRKRLPVSSVTGGLVEDGLVIAIASRYA